MRNYNINQIKKMKSEGYKIAIYCAGLHGTSFKRLLENLGIAVDVFLDNDNEKNGKIIDGLRCVLPYEISGDERYITIICARINLYNVVYDTAIRQGIVEIVDFRCILDDLIIYHSELFLELIQKRFNEPCADIFYTNYGELINIKYDTIKKSRDKIAVYTAAFGNYDGIYDPLSKLDNVDYYYISDNQPIINTDYTWIDSKDIIPSTITTPIKQNRYIKMHPHLIFPDYKYSVYIDANVQVIGDISKMIFDLRHGISVHNHWRRDCLYYEAMTVTNYKRVAPQDVIRQMRRYLSEGFPAHYGLAELSVIVREHNNPECKAVMDTWWQEFNNESQRDQLSFPYALWKNGILMNEVATLGNDVKRCDLIRFYDHNTVSKNIHNDKLL